MPLRKILPDPRFEKELADLRKSDPRIDGGRRAVEWVLERSPEQGYPARGTPYRVWPLNTEAGRYAVYYQFDESSVTLLSVWPVPEERRFY